MIDLGKGQTYRISVMEEKLECASFTLIVNPDDKENWIEYITVKITLNNGKKQK